MAIAAPNSSVGCALEANFDRKELERLLVSFELSVRRQQDRKLAQKLRQELLNSDPPYISAGTRGQLAKWCNTNSPLYWDGQDVARKISQLLFGRILDRAKLGV
jgi:hypothetical protein